MSDTVQMIRVEIDTISAAGDGTVWVYAVDGVDAVEFRVPVVDVIELTEETTESKWITHNVGAAYARRLVSEWEATDEDS